VEVWKTVEASNHPHMFQFPPDLILNISNTCFTEKAGGPLTIEVSHRRTTSEYIGKSENPTCALPGTIHYG
jgi:hypothetical protein